MFSLPEQRQNNVLNKQIARHFADDLNVFVLSHLYFDRNVIQVDASNWQYVSIASVNGLAPNRRQANIWINANPF